MGKQKRTETQKDKYKEKEKESKTDKETEMTHNQSIRRLRIRYENCLARRSRYSRFFRWYSQLERMKNSHHVLSRDNLLR